MFDLNDTFDYIKENYMIRRDEKQKDSFRTYIQSEFSKLGYNLKIDIGTTKIKYNNLVTDNNNFKAVIIAHYDTPNQTCLMNLDSSSKKVDV